MQITFEEQSYPKGQDMPDGFGVVTLGYTFVEGSLVFRSGEHVVSLKDGSRELANCLDMTRVRPMRAGEQVTLTF